MCVGCVINLSLIFKGAEFNSLADTALADRYNQLLDLVTMETEDGEHPIMVALINSVPFDNLVRERERERVHLPLFLIFSLLFFISSFSLLSPYRMS